MATNLLGKRLGLALCMAIGAGFTAASAQDSDLSQPVFRVTQAQAQEPAAPAPQAEAPAAAAPFDLAPREGEHPLMPCVRLAKEALENIDQNIHDYSCKFTKIERIDGELTDPQYIFMKARHKPFSIYMYFLKPYQGREVLYVNGQNNGNLVALEAGWKRKVGKVNLDPNGSMAMNGQKYPITRAGIRNLTAELVGIGDTDTKFGECEVKNYPDVKIDGRPVTMIEAIHPVPRREFKYHIARIYIDNEYRIPVAYEAYSWPTQPGGEPVLEERFIYTNLKLNNGFTDLDFSTENPEIFKP
jgi:hypothetical protein